MSNKSNPANRYAPADFFVRGGRNWNRTMIINYVPV